MMAKPYNRTVRAHKIIKEALERLIMTQFLLQYDEEHRQLVQNNTKECEDAFVQNDLQQCQISVDQLVQLIGPLSNDYEAFKTELSKSNTSQYWVMYIDMVSILQRFIRAERNGLWCLHLDTFGEMLPIFHALGRTHYARWGTVYETEMKMLPTAEPDVFNAFMSGNHVVKRSTQSFNQVSTDLALEQSLNRDCKVKGGLIGKTKKPNAVSKWVLTAHLRANVASNTMKMCDLTSSKTTHNHKESTNNRRSRGENDIRAVMQTVTEVFINPFDIQQTMPHDNVMNICTGATAPDHITCCLKELTNLGSTSVTNFIDERLSSHNVSIFSPIQKQKAILFSDQQKSKKENNKMIETSIEEERQLLGRILMLSQSRPIDLKSLLTFEMSSVPQSLAYPNGTLRKTNKSILLNELEKLVNSQATFDEDELHQPVHIVDGMALIHSTSLSNVRTFGELSKTLLHKVLMNVNEGSSCKRVDVVFDRYISLSIKDSERSTRYKTTPVVIHIRNTSTPLPKQWSTFLCDNTNKRNLTRFLTDDWCEQGQSLLPDGKELYIAGGSEDGNKVMRVTKQECSEVPRLSSTQEEADSRMMLHCNDAVSLGCDTLIISSPDTDVALLGIHYQRDLNVNVWFKTGVKERKRFIPLHDIALAIGDMLCKSILGFHAITGCDTTSSIVQLGKVKPWRVLEQKQQAFQFICKLGDSSDIAPDALKAAETLICSCYLPNQNCEGLDQARHLLFSHRQQKSGMLPPTSHCFSLHMMRANYQTFIWKHALEPNPTIPVATEHGWQSSNGQLLPVLMTKEKLPRTITEMVVCRCKTSKCSRRCGCSVQNLPCTSACTCRGQENCSNPWKQQDSDDADSDSSSDDSDDD